MTPQFFDMKDAAKILKVHRRTVFHIIARLGWKRGPCGKWRFSEQDIQTMARGNR